MYDEIKVHVVKYPDRKNLVMRYVDPESGRQIRRSTGTTNRRDAVKAAGKWEAELREGRYQRLYKLSWQEFREEYEAQILPAKSEATAVCKISAMNHLERVLNPQRVADITTEKFETFQSRLRAEGMRETTIAAHLGHLKPIIRWAVKRKMLREMPEIVMPEAARGVTKILRSRTITLEELERMVAAVPKVRKREPEKWQRLLWGLWYSGLRLGEALALSWDDDASIWVDMSGKYPALRIEAEAEKGHKDRLLPIAPDFAEFLLAVPKNDRRGLVFGIYGPGNRPLTTKRASGYISRIGRKAGVVVDKAEGRSASAHDLRRAFGSRWAMRVRPALLQQLMRHESIKTTMAYYVSIDAEEAGDVLRQALGTISGTSGPVESTADQKRAYN